MVMHNRSEKRLGIGVAVLVCLVIAVAAYTAAKANASGSDKKLIGVSKSSWEEAAKSAVERAGISLDNLRIAEVAQLDMLIDDGKVVGYRAKVKVPFKFQD